MNGFYHVCFVVPDLEASMDELTRAGHVQWQPPAGGHLAGVDYRIAFTRGGPPFIELIQAPPGGPWGDTRMPHFHHLGFWTSSISAGSQRLLDQGCAETFSGCPYGRAFAYHRVESVGGHIELVDAAQQPGFQAAWNPGGPLMPAIDESSTP
ncbi:VOC family protein [Streptomyces sp. H39-C1]|uniref:VOC family protein n=1 Tax=Streptomyces sp. H39-C1 TaxID=3004355 RepID=UPI0022B04A90|nr:VOC family protein [Streptomyces sp. H39-C1]MCZ4101052.1 VOC family protein [Streptomyces sp. H39-C1]